MDLIANIVCRPSRAQYDLEDLGPTSFVLQDGTIVQREFVLPSISLSVRYAP
jgi:hypothetical protein